MISTLAFWLLTLETIILPSNFDSADLMSSTSSSYATAATEGPLPDIPAAKAPRSSAAIIGAYLDDNAADARTPFSFIAFQYSPASASLNASVNRSDRLLSLLTLPLGVLRGRKMIACRLPGASSRRMSRLEQLSVTVKPP